jgi:WD40-like Beta Propeller Repeat
MTRSARVFAVLLTFATHGCMSSSLVLQVFPDGHGRGVITTRLFESSMRAFDGMFPGTPPPSKNFEDELPAPFEGELERAFGAKVKIASSRLEKAADGAVRTTVVEFDDVTKLRLTFPPVFAGAGAFSSGFTGMTAPPLITFAMKPHENGDRLLLVRMPDDRMQPRADPEMTVFKENSAEEQMIKRAVKGAALRFAVELDQDIPLLRTNAPAQRGNRATILDLDLDRLINGLDEERLRRAMAPGSMQEVLWQLADMPGAVVPTEHEVFLEFEPPRTQQQPPPPAPAQAAAAQAPPDTEIYLAPMKVANGTIEIGAPVNITNSPGYDNQPFFTPDGAAVLFTSIRGAGAATSGAATQTDIYRYDIGAKRISQVTNTPESEYSPTIAPSGALSLVRVELDGNNTQRLWQFTADGRDPKVVLENVKPVGYHAWADERTLALFVLGQPATLQIADTRTGTARTVATDIGRSLQRIPGSGAARPISFVQRERHGEMVHLTIKEWNPATGAIETLTPAVEGASEADLAWTPDGTLLMAKEGVLYSWRRRQTGWKEVTSLQRLGLSRVTRLAVSPKGNAIALVASPPQER